MTEAARFAFFKVVVASQYCHVYVLDGNYIWRFYYLNLAYMLFIFVPSFWVANI